MNRKYAKEFAEAGRMKVQANAEPEEIVAGAIRRAFGDAASHVLHTPADFDRQAARERAFAILRQKLNDLPQDPQAYDKWHRDTCSAVRAPYANGNGSYMTYGIATKWVDMTIKYLFLHMTLTENAFSRPLVPGLTKDIEQKAHVPVDSYILESVAANPDPKRSPDVSPCDFRIKVLTKDGDYGYYAPSKTLGWSRYDFAEDEWNAEKDAYHALQKGIREHIGDECALDWETRIWLRAKENRTARQKKRQRATDERSAEKSRD